MNKELNIKLKVIDKFWKAKLEEDAVQGLPEAFFIKEITATPHQETSRIELPSYIVDGVGNLCGNDPTLSYIFFLTGLFITFKKYGAENRIPVLHGGFQELNSGDGNVLYVTDIASSDTFKETFLKLREEVVHVSQYPMPAVLQETYLENISKIGFHVENMGISPVLHGECDVLINLKTIEGTHFLEMTAPVAVNSNITENFLHSFQFIFSQILKDPQIKIEDIQPLDVSQKKVVLEDFNLAPEGHELKDTIIDIFEKNAEFFSDQIALQYKDKTWSYAELNNKVNQLSHAVQSFIPLKKEDRVVIITERTDVFLQTVLAVWKCNCCYIPVDPIYPDDRIKEIIEDSDPSLIIIEDSVSQREKLKTVLDKYSTFSIDEWKEKVTQYPVSNPPKVTHNDNLAYIIYTSGSTGKPKGVVIEHIGMLNHIYEKIGVLDIDSSSIVAQNASQGFDISVWQMFSALVKGGKTVIYDDHVVYNVVDFIQQLAKDHVSVLELVPSYFLEILNVLEAKQTTGTLSAIEHLVLNAETLKHDLVKRWFTLYPGKPISNTYGATEVSDDICHYVMTDIPDSITVPVKGKMFANIKMYVLDDDMHPVPVGVTGNIYIAGFPVGRGYFNNPQKTSEAFLYNPFNTQKEKLYKTGDMGRYLSCGSMEFLGRKDYQVKVRGHRVELGEIENHLHLLEGINNAIVIDLVDSYGQVYLAAYVDKQTFSSVDLEVEAIKNSLEESLPAYMIPLHIIIMDKLPLNVNGKIDRKALPLPEENFTAASSRKHVPAVTELEKTMVKIWEEVLNTENIGITDNFFELGGHSLMVDQVINRMYKKVGKKISFRTFFGSPSIKKLIETFDASENTQYKSIPLAEAKNSYAVTSSQKRLWILSQIEEGNLAYNSPAAISLKGHLEIDKLEKSFEILIKRHEILRTYFKMDATGELKQYILPEAQVNFTIESDDYSYERHGEISAYLHSLNSHQFILDTPLLLRAHLIKMEDDEYVFFLSLHHILIDGWSVEILMSELVQVYNALVKNTHADLPFLALQYKDYAEWAQEETNNGTYHAAEKYWIEQFEGEIPSLNMPTSLERPSIQTFNGNIQTAEISSELSDTLRKFCADQDATLFMFLMTLVNVLLHKYSQQNDIIIGTPVSGREHPDLENQIGLFINTLPIRTTLDPQQSFQQLLSQEKENILKAFEHQQYSFDELVSQLALPRDLSRSVLFDVLVVLQNQMQLKNINRDTLNELEVSNYDFISKTAKFDFTFNFIDGDVLQLVLEYNTDVYTDDFITEFLKHYKFLLQDILAHSGNPMYSLDYLSPEENNDILTAFNSTFRPLEYTSVIERFQYQAERTPNDLAVSFEDVTLTYKELNERANQLSCYLQQEYHIQKNDYVAVKMTRSCDFIVAIISILKLGTAYVPIDPSYPEERIDYILENAAINIIIDQDFIDQFNVAASGLSCENPSVLISGEDPVYIIYTSGSTGTPKGIVMPNQSMNNLIDYHILEIPDSRKTMQFTSISFDVSFQEIFSALCSGGCLYPISDDTKRHTEKLIEFIKGFQIDTIFLPTAYFKMLGELDHWQAFLLSESCLKNIIVAGEQLILSDELRKVLHISSVKLHNHYGPAETHVATMITLDHSSLTAIPSIGRPISNTQLYILDAYHRPVGIGVTGELYIAGAGLARGYLNNTALTEEKFIPNPFSEEPDSRMYHTGDLGRWLPDGNIEYLGRKDHQVKIRGFRIELGEIENTILSYGDHVTGCVVDVRGTDSDKQLVAYYVCSGGVSLDKAELRAYLQSKLPEYMVPSFFVELESISLTSNGKIDRKSLPQVGHSDIITQEYTAPQTPEEHLLVGIWEDVLKLDKISIHDNFFDLGGNSLIVAQVINRIEKQLGSSVSFRDFFTSPTISELCGKLVKTGMNESIPVIAKNSSYEVSPSQRRLWVLSQLEGGSKAYNMPVTVRLRGVLDTEKFKSSFELLLARHEILRTYFKLDAEGHLRQYITDSIELGSFWEEYNSTNESDSSEIISRISSHVFDLSSPYLFRLGLIKEDDSSYLFTFTIHHILSDGWSLSVLINDLIKIYNSLVSGEESGLSPLSIQYKDYADWLNKKLSNNNIDSRSFWHSHLEGEIPVLQLPSFKKRPSVQTYNGSNSFYVFSGSFLESLEDFGKSRQSTLFMVLMAGVKALLRRYSGQDDIIVGSPIAGRDHTELESQIGLYLNTLALRTRYESENSFESLLLQEKDTLLKAYQYQDYPFDRLIDELSVKRDISRSPLFDVMVVLQNQQQVVSLDGGGSFNGFEVEEYAMEGNTAQFDLSFNFSQHADGLSLTINYNTDIYDRSFVDHIFIHLEKLLLGAISSPDSAIERLNYLSEEEEQTVLSDFNRTTCDYETEKTLIDLFEKQVRLTPDQPAIIYEGFSLSYREADEEANRLSHYILDTISVEPDNLIAVKLERSTDLIVTLLAILKSGCAYVPIDPSYPSERIEYIESNSGSLLTIDEDFWNRFKAKRDLIPATSVPRIISPDNLAYVIYTSGTTGNPKGVMIEHRNVVNLMYSFSSGSQENCRTSLTCNYSFDATIIEIFDSLVSGSTLYIPSRETVSMPSKYALYIIENCITHCYIHPMFIEEISSILKEKNYTGLKKILIGVEPIRYKTVNYFLDNGVEVINAYGPTEITVCCTFMKVEQGNPDEIIPIGKPIDNTQLYILDAYHNPVGVGMTGELYIAGAGLARGYLNNTALTEEKFISNPFSEEPGSRMYHTGDLGRWLPDGNIEFLGRKDHQVKIRGFRIELGEIENTILSYGDSVTGCVVDVRGTDNDKQIVAYYVCSEGQSIDKTELRSHIQRKLPEYMVPSFFVELESIPLTSNGKIDRKSLPQVGHSDIITKEYTAPQTSEEHLLVGIWEDVLKLDKISIHDNFFDLGGNSLIVAQVINRIEKQLGSSVSFRDFFTSPTISELCGKLVKTGMDESIPVIAKNISYEVSPSQRRLWVLSQLEGGSKAYNMPVTVRLKGVLDTEKFKSSFELLLSRHEILRTYFKLDAEGHLHQYITDSFELGSFWEEYNSVNESDSSEIISRISSHVFDLSSPYLFRLGLIKEDDSNYLFTFTIHHILSDGWSLSVLINDLIRIYNSLVSGEESGLSPLSIQYKDYADWLNKKLSNNNIDSRSFWHSHLEGELPVLQLPSFKTRPVVQTYNGSDSSYVFPGSFLESLEDFGKSRQSTLFMVLMAGVKALLRRYSGQDDIIVGSPIAGRDHAELENQIGLYLNTLALRTRYESENSFESLLLQEKDTLLKAYQYQDYPFDRLIDELSVKRDISRSPLFDVMVVLQNQQQVVSLDGGGSFNGFEVEEYTMEGNTAQFDLSFNFSQHADGLSLNINYNTDIYDRSFINHIFIHLEKLLTQAISSPDSAIERLNYLSEEQEQEVLEGFNKTACDYEREKTIIDLFEQQCALTPDADAVIYEDQKLSYKALNERSNRLSHYILDTVSVEPEDLIAVKLERSSDLIVTLLAILKSGCAYVPIDPSYPSERIEYIENNSGSKLTIDAEFLAGFENAAAVQSANNPERNISSNHLAYVIYTSGTTGNPKGVMIEHGNALQLVLWAKQEFKNTDFDIVYAGTSFCFDLSVYEMFYPLSIGKSIRVLKNALEGLSYMNTDKNILLNTVPSVLETVHEQLFDNKNIKAINLAGEPLSVHLVERINEKVELRNLYGPSEDTTYSTCSLIPGRRNSMISIGKPISNTEVYILDAYHRPVGVGMTGDLYISGLGLSRGYLNNAALTDEKFLPNPFSEESGSRMYHTGDLARWLADGNIEFLGRKDHQVKIRGFRIELGEIENTILGYGDSVTGCVVEVRGTDSEKQLVAYYVCSEGMSMDKSKLRAYLHGKLPEYMVPSFFVELESIPLTPNGKIDRKALPQVGHSDIATKEYTAPETPEEHLLVGIWEDVLKLDRISIHDNFFELGGNSISLVSIWNKMQKLAGTQISFHEFFRKPTIYDVLNTKNAALTQEDVDTKQDKTIYFIPPVIGFSLIFNELISILHSDFNCYSFDYKGILEDEPAFASVNEASEYFSGKIAERTKDRNEKIIILGYSMGGNIGFEITKILEEKYKNIELILLDSYAKDSVVNNENEFKSIENYLKANDIEISSDIENLVLNNLRIFAKYVQSGEIASKVTLLKSASNTQNMDIWRKYTTGELLVKEISGSHWEALSSSNLKLITNVLYEKQN